MTEKKGAAETQLSEISGKYSDLQDTLYDIKQIHINKNKEYSIQIWRLLTKLHINNNIHNKTINQLTKQFLSDKKNILKESKKEVEKEVENIYKLCKTFETIETYHKNIYNTYISYKADTTLSINNDIIHIRDELEKLAVSHNILLAKKSEVRVLIVYKYMHIILHYMYTSMHKYTYSAYIHYTHTPTYIMLVNIYNITYIYY